MNQWRRVRFPYATPLHALFESLRTTRSGCLEDTEVPRRHQKGRLENAVEKSLRGRLEWRRFPKPDEAGSIPAEGTD